MFETCCSVSRFLRSLKIKIMSETAFVLFVSGGGMYDFHKTNNRYITIFWGNFVSGEHILGGIAIFFRSISFNGPDLISAW